MALMAMGSHGTTLHGIDEKCPRKDLLDRLSATHAGKVYVDTTNGDIRHVGYIVRGEWYRLYNVAPWEGKK